MRAWWLCCALFTLPAHALTVTDDVGNPVTLAAPAMRIVSLAPSITENLFAIGAGVRIVGTSASSDYPAAALQIPVISDYQSVNLERVAALKPDVIVVWQGGTSPAQLAALTQLHIPIFMHRATTLSDIPLSLMRLAQLTGLETTAAPMIFDAYQKINLLKDAPLPSLSAFYQVWHAPLMTLNRNNWVSDALARCGAVNLFADLSITAPTVNIETVLQKNPALIITASPNGLPNNELDMWRKWRDIAAVKNNALLFVDSDSMNRATLRTLAASTQMCAQIDKVRRHV